MSRLVEIGLVWAALSLIGPLLSGCDTLIDDHVNAVTPDVTAEKRPFPPNHDMFHKNLFIADLHADTMMWDRDILVENSRGHLDLPRMRQSNIRLQVFTVVTVTPALRKGEHGFECVSAQGVNTMGVLSVVQMRDSSTWSNHEQRALKQAERLHQFADRTRELRAREQQQGHKTFSVPELRIIKTLEDLDYVMRQPLGGEPDVIGAVLGIEGAHWLAYDDPSENEIANRVKRLSDVGFRSLALTHRFDNGLGGASEGCDPSQGGKGLTALGAAALHAMEDNGMILDLAHASSRTIRDALDIFDGPVLMSHGGAHDHCAEPCFERRNLRNEDIREIAHKGGVIGIGFWPEAVGTGVSAIAHTMAYTVSVLASGSERFPPSSEPCRHIAFGSDFDGAVTVPFDAAGLSTLTADLRRYDPKVAGYECFAEDELPNVAGLNICRVLAAGLGGTAQVCRRTYRQNLDRK